MRLRLKVRVRVRVGDLKLGLGWSPLYQYTLVHWIRQRLYASSLSVRPILRFLCFACDVEHYNKLPIVDCMDFLS